MASQDAPPSFDDIIQAGRQRKRNEALAKRIFGRGRGSRNGHGKRRTVSTSRLASGAGVAKVRHPPATHVEDMVCFREEHSRLTYQFVQAQQRTASNVSKPNANINGPWTHDLHSLNDSQASQASPLRSPSRPERAARDDRIYETLPSDTTIRAPSNGLSIRGSAGPFTVVASNFAPGTTAEDIEVALESTGGEIVSCGLISTYPTVDAEIVFCSKRGAEDVIAAFNNQRADGRLLHVYMKSRTSQSDSYARGGRSRNLHSQYGPNSEARRRSRSPIANYPDKRYDGEGDFRSDERGLYSDQMLRRGQDHGWY